jgi:hypothetical protein
MGHGNLWITYPIETSIEQDGIPVPGAGMEGLKVCIIIEKSSGGFYG